MAAPTSTPSPIPTPTSTSTLASDSDWESDSFEPRQIPEVGSPDKLFLQLDLPGIPPYIFNDRSNSYCPPSSLGLPPSDPPSPSVFTFDLTHDPSGNRRLLLGSASLLLPPKGWSDPIPWTKLTGLTGWHRTSGPISGFCEYVSKWHPSRNYRGVYVEGEYSIAAGEGEDEGAWVVKVRVESLVGKEAGDCNDERQGRDWIEGGKKEFEVVARKGEGGNVWDIVGAEGVEVQEGYTGVDWEG
ncbi:hypothetical protein B0T16DRAFT_490593 [Cercophora newfieldiana]|uniref:Uncharacterized protein n=1 Tax=Cercophora newfieldiana TaxID=92897 RepID=A0AA39YHN3_9PEZI|nr:hypothetical protein B0T16DRAFT_490593 [Cercophora newfieldiana]